jgi:enoyl-CoA hydratase
MQVSITRKNRIATITFESGVLNRSFREDLWQAFTHLEQDPQTGAIIVTGRKNLFMAGADLKEVTALQGEEDVAAFLGLAHRLVHKFCESPIPVVAAINGYCLGGGLELALACDLRFAVSDFHDTAGSSVPYLGFPETQLGLIPAVGGAHLAAQVLGAGRAKELLFDARPITAQRAYEIGLVNRLSTRARLMHDVEEAVSTMLSNSSLAIGETKRLVTRSFYTADLGTALDEARQAFAVSCQSRDTVERIARSREEQRQRFRRSSGAAA